MINSILLQTSAPIGKQGGLGQWGGILMMVLIFVVFYLFLIRPQSKRQKELRKFQDSLEKGKHVVTSGGIFGTIKEVKTDRVVLEIASGVHIEVSKSSVFDATDPKAAAEQANTPAK